MSEIAATETVKRRRLGRSPAYPSFPVQKALEQIKALYEQERRYWAPLASAVKSWGYGAKSNVGRQALATMKYYGLVDISGEGDARRIKVSETALKILRNLRQDNIEKRQLIHRVAMMPSAHKLLEDEYPIELASDETVQYFLIENGFNEQSARELLEEFKETASFIGLYDPHRSVDKEHGKGASRQAEDVSSAIRVGDRIQWVVNGAERFAEGGVVEAIHPSGEWLWVSEELTESAIPMRQVDLVERGAGDASAPPPRPKEASRASTEEPKVEVGKQKVTLEGEVLTIIASVQMSELGSLKKKIEGLEKFYNA